jgi:hypothetical protein
MPEMAVPFTPAAATASAHTLDPGMDTHTHASMHTHAHTSMRTQTYTYTHNTLTCTRAQACPHTY